MVKITFGANEDKVKAGTSVAQAREEYKDVLNIADEAVALINGEEVERNAEQERLLEDDDCLEFVKDAGDKG
jgi:hypothetical protein